MDCNKVCKKITTGLFIVVLSISFLLILLQFFIKNVLIETFNMDNVVTSWSVTGKEDSYVEVDWSSIYPKNQEASANVNPSEKSKENKLVAKFRNLCNTVDKYSSDYLPFKEYVKIPSGVFDRVIGNHMVDPDNMYLYTEDGGLMVREPIHQPYTKEQLDTTILANRVFEFKDYLNQQGIEFMYVQTPVKENIFDAEYEAKYELTYANQLANDLLSRLSSGGVDVLDLRERLQLDGWKCFDAFFESDTHWNIEAAFWATKVFAQKLNEDYDYKFDLDKYNEENYEKIVYKDWVFGTMGRSATLVNVGYDDISIYKPTFETKLRMVVPNLAMDSTGDFMDTMINPVAFERRSPLYHGAFDAFAYSKPPITEVTNLLEKNNTKSILLLRESYAGPVITYLSLGVENLYAITPEGYSGSIKGYINDVKPDMVVIFYTAPLTNELTSKYEFE